MPVLSSDDDSDRDGSQSSGNDREGDRRTSPPQGSSGEFGQNKDSVDARAVKDARVVAGVEAGVTPAAGSGDDGNTTDLLLQDQEVLFTTMDFYLVLRMHHLLAERLAAAKRLCREAGSCRQTVVASPQEVGRSTLFSHGKHVRMRPNLF